MTANELAAELRESSRPKIRFAAADMLECQFVSPRYDPKRSSDRIEALTEQLAFEKKRSAALLSTITRLESEVAQSSRANAQLVQTIMELRNAK